MESLYLPRHPVAEGDDVLLSKVRGLCHRYMESVERSHVLIARTGQLITASDQRMKATEAVRAPVRAATPGRRPIYNRINRDSLLEQVRETRARSVLIFRQTREIIAHSRTLLIQATA